MRGTDCFLSFQFDFVCATICVTILSVEKAKNRGCLCLPWLSTLFNTGNIRRLGQSSGSCELYDLDSCFVLIHMVLLTTVT